MKTGADHLAAAAAAASHARAHVHTHRLHIKTPAPGRRSVLLTGASLFQPVWDQRPWPRNTSRVSETHKRTRVKSAALKKEGGEGGCQRAKILLRAEIKPRLSAEGGAAPAD